MSRSGCFKQWVSARPNHDNGRWLTGLIIQNNIAGINSARNKGISEGRMRKSLEKLSSGYRINRAGDDAAGLTISELMRSQITGINQALRNVNDGISLTQTGDGALAEVHSMLGRMKTLAVQSANGTYTTAARANLDFERQQLIDEINRIGETSNFDGISLFGTEEVPEGEPIPWQVGDIQLQVGCSEEEILKVKTYSVSDKGLRLDQIDLTSISSANDSIPYIDEAIEAVADIRANFGANQNHLEHTHNNLTVTNENMMTAESRIRDTDMADEFTLYTKDNITFQSATQMAARANSLPELVMNLLR